MTGIIVSAPGKVILFGEHAVVHGKAAVAAAASDLRVVVTLVSLIIIRLKVRVRVRLRFRVRVKFKVRVRVGMWGPFDVVFWCCWFSALVLPII